MNTKSPDEADRADQAWADFLQNLGPDDIYRQILVEELFAMLGGGVSPAAGGGGA